MKKPVKGAPPPKGKGVAPSVVIMIGARPPGQDGDSPVPPPKGKVPPPKGKAPPPPMQTQKQGIRNSINQAIKQQSGKVPPRGKP
jgi:hypothetical protein